MRGRATGLLLLGELGPGFLGFEIADLAARHQLKESNWLKHGPDAGGGDRTHPIQDKISVIIRMTTRIQGRRMISRKGEEIKCF